MRCPSCNSHLIKRKRRQGIKKLLPFVRTYKCGVCKTTFEKVKV